MDRARAIGVQQAVKLKIEGCKILACLIHTDSILLAQPHEDLLLRSSLKDQVSQQGSRWIQMHHAIGIDDQRAGAIWIDPQVDARLLAEMLVLAYIVIKLAAA